MFNCPKKGVISVVPVVFDKLTGLQKLFQWKISLLSMEDDKIKIVIVKSPFVRELIRGNQTLRGKFAGNIVLRRRLFLNYDTNLQAYRKLVKRGINFFFDLRKLINFLQESDFQ